MIFLKKFFWGYECIRIIISQNEGCSFERFINICKAKKIHIWNRSCNYDDGIIIMIYHNCLDELENIAEKCDVKLVITKAGGLPYYIRSIYNNTSTTAGVIVGIIVVLFCNLFIWDINYAGNYKYSDNWMDKISCREKVYVGVMKKNINCELFETNIRHNYPDISFVSAYIEGCVLKMTIKEGIVYEGIQDDKSSSSLYAETSGEIVSIITRSGTPKVKEGDYVEKGQCIVEGKYDIVDDSGEIVSCETVNADADIMIKVCYDKKFQIPREYSTYEYDDEIGKGLYIIIQNKKKMLYKSLKTGSYCDIMNCKMPNSIFGRTYYYQYNINVEKYDANSADCRVKQIINSYIDELKNNNISVEQYDYSLSFNDEYIDIDASFTAVGRYVTQSDVIMEDKIEH